MEIHSVLPEERARDENNNPLPWGYRYADSSKNPRQPPEESGPFGKNRSVARSSFRGSRTRTGTTPIRKVEDPTVAEFSRLFSSQQKEEEDSRAKNIITTSSDQPAPKLPAEPVPAQECLIYGYASKAVEWKVLTKYEKISTGHICEDYPRTDPDVLLHRASVIVPPSPLSKDALRKSRTYKGGQHWIKVTFDSYIAAEKACFHSPQEIDGHWVICEMWQGHGPGTDTAILANSQSSNDSSRKQMLHSLTSSQPMNRHSATQDDIGRSNTLPRSINLPDVQYAHPGASLDDSSTVSNSSTTASSATATNTLSPHQDSAQSTGLQSPSGPGGSNLRSRSVPSLPVTNLQNLGSSEYMTAIPTVKRAVLKPISEALAPQPSITEKILRTIPIVNLFFGPNRNEAYGGIIGSGPVLREDGSFDEDKNGWYWAFWYRVDNALGTDFCGITGED